MKFATQISPLLNLVNTFYDLFRQIYMSPDSPDSHMKVTSILIEQGNMITLMLTKIILPSWMSYYPTATFTRSLKSGNWSWIMSSLPILTKFQKCVELSQAQTCCPTIFIY